MVEHRAAQRLRPPVVGEALLHAARIDLGLRLTDDEFAHPGKFAVIVCLRKGRLDDIAARVLGNGIREFAVSVILIDRRISVGRRDTVGVLRQTAAPLDRRRVGFVAVRPAFDGNGEGKTFARPHDLELDLSGAALVVIRLGDRHREGISADLGGDISARPAARRIRCRHIATARVGGFCKSVDIIVIKYRAIHPAVFAFFILLLKGERNLDRSAFDGELCACFGSLIIMHAADGHRQSITSRLRGRLGT